MRLKAAQPAASGWIGSLMRTLQRKKSRAANLVSRPHLLIN
jgi:hypothetical protein